MKRDKPALCWINPFLPDIDVWAEGVSSLLKENGKFVLIDFHPFVETLNWRRHHGRFPYFGDGKPITYKKGITDYIKSWRNLTTPSGYKKGVLNFRNPHQVHYFQWGVSQVIGSLLSSGLNLKLFQEYAHTNGAKQFMCMKVTEDRAAVLPDKYPSLPLMFSVIFNKPNG